jgi:hypothetical protein
MMIPKILHFVWKDEAIPAEFRHYHESWRRHHPDWEVKVWTDQQSESFIAAHHPDLMALYQSYPQAICRADIIRYLVLEYFGGVYADLDVECLRPIDPLLAPDAVVLGVEPPSHSQQQAGGVARIVCNAWMASPPGHPFWQHLRAMLKVAGSEANPRDATGPYLLTKAIDSYQSSASIRVLDAVYLYPFDKEDCWSGRVFNQKYFLEKTREAYAVHHWSGSWFRRPALHKGLVLDEVGVIISSPPGPDKTAKIRGLRSWQSTNPLVSCVMVSWGKLMPARFAIECFLAQTYENRELVIVCDQPQTELGRYVEQLNNPSIRYVGIAYQQFTLGILRNIAISLCHGEYVCQWDDDDLSDPMRIHVSLSALLLSGAVACFLSSWVMWWPRKKSLSHPRVRPWEGSMLARRDVIPIYPSLAKSEDTFVLSGIVQRHTVVLVDCPRLYIYVVTGFNTWDQEHFAGMVSNADYVVLLQDYDRALEQLNQRVPIHDYQAALLERQRDKHDTAPD